MPMLTNVGSGAIKPLVTKPIVTRGRYEGKEVVIIGKPRVIGEESADSEKPKGGLLGSIRIKDIYEVAIENNDRISVRNGP